ncbi:ParB N-terminal domain-containing protein [Anaerosporobacter sp.]|uniref:ParB N-terminal domain-containing protein n=1 Tax=Anaerosporobacter sp. TaxID=1872529 RepID=UPI00286EF0CD|nr:ParB N-terminal domain-containing protein [Anaerosporobacter sp.]
MIYGTYSIAKEYTENGNIEQWIQLFLRNDGKNLALADGLLLEKRHYIGLRKISIELLSNIESGAPKYLKDDNSIKHFFAIVDKMKEYIEHWDAPPLIVNYVEGRFEVNDGRHRLEMYRQLKMEYVYVVLWVTEDEDYNKLMKLV